MCQVLVCQECEETVDIDSAQVMIDGREVCDDCAYEINNPVETCPVCEESEDACECYVCEDCNNRTQGEDVRRVRDRDTRRYDRFVCVTCYDREYEECTDCREAVHANDACKVNDAHYCGSCYSDRFILCDECATEIDVNNDDYLAADSGNTYCDDCAAHYRRHNLIRDYHSRPELIFYGKKTERRYGWELEVEGSRDGEIVHQVAQAFNGNEHEKHVWFNNDGSLHGNGYEIISHPATFDYHMRHFPWESALAELERLGYKSHDTTTCGLHVHISRAAFGKDSDEQQYRIGRFVYMIEKFYPQVLKLSRRTETKMREWAARYGIEQLENPKAAGEKLRYIGGRYKIVNLSNAHTVEVRAWRGTLKFETWRATFEFVHHLVSIAMSDNNLEQMTWDGLINLANRNGLVNIYNYVHDKEIY